MKKPRGSRETAGLATLTGDMTDSCGHTLAIGHEVIPSVEDTHERIRALYRLERDSVARHLRVLTGDPSLVDDLVNETFIRAFQSLEGFSERSSLRTWLHGIAVNVARNHRAKHWRRHRTRLPRPVATVAASPEEELSERRALGRFYQAVETLELPLREAFVLRVIEQHALKGVAEILGIPVSTAHARAMRAEQRIRAFMEGEH